MSQKIRVLIVDDQALIRTGIQSLLVRKPDIEVVGQAGNGAEAMTLVQELQPDVVLMDVIMPGMDGVEATRRICRDDPAPAVIILTTFRDDEYILRGLAAGARGYLLKDVDHRELAEAVRIVAGGGALLHPDITARLLPHIGRITADSAPPRPSETEHRYLELLTGREREILRMLAQGRTNQEISDDLAISIGTTKNHISNILSKLNVRDRTQAALWAQRIGMNE